MLLADAIERYALANRTSLDRSQQDLFRLFWSTIRMSEVGALDLETMTRDDSDLVMVLFDKADRVQVAETLNLVRAWSMRRTTGSRAAEGSRPPAVRTATPAERRETGSASARADAKGRIRRHDDEPFAAQARPDPKQAASDSTRPTAPGTEEETAAGVGIENPAPVGQQLSFGDTPDMGGESEPSQPARDEAETEAGPTTVPGPTEDDTSATAEQQAGTDRAETPAERTGAEASLVDDQAGAPAPSSAPAMPDDATRELPHPGSTTQPGADHATEEPVAAAADGSVDTGEAPAAAERTAKTATGKGQNRSKKPIPTTSPNAGHKPKEVKKPASHQRDAGDGVTPSSDRRSATAPPPTGARVTGARVTERRAAAKPTPTELRADGATPGDEPALFGEPFSVYSRAVARPALRPPDQRTKLFWAAGALLVAIGLILLTLAVVFPG